MSPSEGRLIRAGASRVVAPYAISAHRMVALALNPAVVEFGDLVTADGEHGLSVAEIVVGAGSSLEGTTLAASDLTGAFGVVPVGLVGLDGSFEPVSNSTSPLSAGSVILVLGAQQAVEKLADTCRGIGS